MKNLLCLISGASLLATVASYGEALEFKEQAVFGEMSRAAQREIQSTIDTSKITGVEEWQLGRTRFYRVFLDDTGHQEIRVTKGGSIFRTAEVFDRSLDDFASSRPAQRISRAQLPDAVEKVVDEHSGSSSHSIVTKMMYGDKPVYDIAYVGDDACCSRIRVVGDGTIVQRVMPETIPQGLIVEQPDTLLTSRQTIINEAAGASKDAPVTTKENSVPVAPATQK